MAQKDLFGVSPRIAASGDTPPVCGFAIGTIIYTLDGALPVEHLTPGDKIITRLGAQVLIGIDVSPAGFALRFEKPQIVYADGVETRAA